MRLKRVLAPLALAALSACGQGNDHKAPADAGSSANSSVLPPDGDAQAASDLGRSGAQTPAKDPPLDRLDGVHIGETVAQLKARGIAATKDEGPDPDNSCGYVRIPGISNVDFMLDGDTVVRIDVIDPDVPTLGGVRVGMKESEALRRLGDRANVLPDPDGGPDAHDIAVHDLGAPLGLIVRTDGETVLNYRFGRWTEVQWHGGCL